MKFTDCEKAGFVEGFALIKTCDKKSAKNGTFYLDIKIGDKDSEMVAKLWDFKEEVHTLPEVNTVVKIRGTVQQYNGNDQFIIQRMRPAQDDEYDMADFVKTSDYSGSDMLDSIVRIVNGFEDDELKRLVLSMLSDNKENLLFFPAAEKLHHAMTGGLLYHTLSIVRLAECVCSIYPCIDRELLLSGAILHDIAKMREYSVNAAGIVDGHTLEGMLLGHLVMGAEDVGKKCDELGIAEEKKFLLQHMLISHHGKLEFGAAVRPAFIEAEVLSQLDLFDANMYEMAEAVGGVKAGEFTGRLWMLDNRKLYNHGRIDVEPQANIMDGE
ncbi:MAG: 3'-5' exoribonuclease YhaM family protein [Acutalibacteraceae bacterium]